MPKDLEALSKLYLELALVVPKETQSARDMENTEQIARLEAEKAELVEALACLYALVQGESPHLLENELADDLARAVLAKHKKG